MTHGLAMFDEAPPDDENILVRIEESIREPGPQLVRQPRLQPLS